MRIVRFISMIAAVAVILSLSCFAADPVITGQPTDFYFPAGGSGGQVSFSVQASGDNLTYQWQTSANNGQTWTNLSTSTSSTPNLSINVSGSLVGKQKYRVIVSNSDGSTISNVVSVTVGAFTMDTIPQMLQWVTDIGESIFLWIGSACSCIIDTPLLLAGVSFFALGAAIAILSRLLSRS